ncbi:hypothetical protein CGGC5_v012323 [Colletotrichum fructicola Nara gc5]|uniref:Uncharacterized protein n=1 Tax=Colletotrichum fructicola (strain Nara gc5) TaxID=1213859 RepID=A0A7J6IP30_COLFN|nr:hypothetical protein CGGC5_v012323 [Colletotrichum fructicola Nara gc5]
MGPSVFSPSAVDEAGIRNSGTCPKRTSLSFGPTRRKQAQLPQPTALAANARDFDDLSIRPIQNPSLGLFGAAASCAALPSSLVVGGTGMYLSAPTPRFEIPPSRPAQCFPPYLPPGSSRDISSLVRSACRRHRDFFIGVASRWLRSSSSTANALDTHLTIVTTVAPYKLNS